MRKRKQNKTKTNVYITGDSILNVMLVFSLDTTLKVIKIFQVNLSWEFSG